MYLKPMLDEILTVEERAVVARAEPLPKSMLPQTPPAGSGSGTIRWRRSRTGCAQGFNTIELAKKHGGQELSFSCKLRAFEEIAKADFAFAFAMINHHNACARFARDGQPGQVARLLPRMLTGDVIGCARPQRTRRR